MKISVSQPYLTDHCKTHAIKAINEEQISGLAGSYIEKFEKEFAKYIGVKYAVSCTNGTAALHLSLIAAGVKSGDDVLVADLTNMATFFAVQYVGANPIPIDILLDTYTIDPLKVEEKITPKTKAIIIVHLFGQPADISVIMPHLKARNIKIIEDCAEAHGSKIFGKMVGSIGNFGAFSFFGNKNLTSGEGGIITTNDKSAATRLRNIRSLAFGIVGNKFVHEEIGYNYRLTNVHAAIAFSQTQNAENLISKRISVCEKYDELLNNFKELVLPVKRDHVKNTYWMYHVRIKEPDIICRESLTSFLSKVGVETRNGFVPYSQQNNINKKSNFNNPNANLCAKTTFYIPTFLDITTEQQQYVVESLILAFKSIKK